MNIPILHYRKWKCYQNNVNLKFCYLTYSICCQCLLFSLFLSLIFSWITLLGINYLCCVAVLALGFPQQEAFLERFALQYGERFCRCSSVWRKTIKASKLPHFCREVSYWHSQSLGISCCTFSIFTYRWNLFAMCTVSFFRVSNWVWIYTKAALMVEAGEWVSAATDCVYSYIMWKEDFYREVWENNSNFAFSNSSSFQLRFDIARPQQMFSKHLSEGCDPYVLISDKSNSIFFWKCDILLTSLCCKCMMLK